MGDEGPWTGTGVYPFGLGAVIDQLTVAGAAVHIMCYTHGGASMTCGSSASTTVPAGVARMTTLHGSSSPVLRSMPSA
jgi:hypothetical protein